MLRSVKQLCGKKLGALDGEIGHVRDFYFDDQKWVIRYVVADTGSWLAERLVLIAPHAFESLFQEDDRLLVNLTRVQIQNSPEIASHKPVSRQYEEEYYRYYGWPSYWDGDGMWGISGFPVAPTPDLKPVKQSANGRSPNSAKDSHLRSAKALSGYHIQTEQDGIGHLMDFTMDDESWEIRKLIVDTGHWLSGKEIAIAPEQIERISYDDSTVFVGISKESIMATPERRFHTREGVLQVTRNVDSFP